MYEMSVARVLDSAQKLLECPALEIELLFSWPGVATPVS